jgi:Zn-dependent protease
MGEAAAVLRCPECATEWGSALLACPGCQRLVHAETLRTLAEEAERQARAGDPAAALASWRRAVELLPAGSRQRALVMDEVAALSREVERAGRDAGPAPGSRWARILAPLGVAGALLWKLKFLVVLALTKAKLLLVGLTKAPTLFSALASFGVYWTAWGWKFAAGLIAAMYVHEMGHVFALGRYGIRATAPMFVPGVGAFVRLQQYPASPREDARVGLAGPMWGLFAAAAVWAGAILTGWPSWAAVARAAAWLNLFNLLPIGSLDGGRGFRSLSQGQRWIVAAGLGATWWATHEALVGLLGLAAAARAGLGRGAEPDRGTLGQFLFLIVALAALCAASARHATP